MPELPDVEILKEYLDSTSLHQTIESVSVLSNDILEDASAGKLEAELKGRSLESSVRHGKYLFAAVGGGPSVVLHFGMTGSLKYFKNPRQQPPHARVLFDFSNGYSLAFDSQRKLGTITLAKNTNSFISSRKLGPDALDPELDLSLFQKILSGSKASVKSGLMNQKKIAGIGNIYSDEILFQAHVHPAKKLNQLEKTEIGSLFRAMKAVLAKAIECRADPEKFPRCFLIPHRRSDGLCPKCGRTVKTLKVSGRSAYYCPGCQK